MAIYSFRVVGVTHDNRQELIEEFPRKFSGDFPVLLKAEPENKYDDHAVAVLNQAGECLGYVGRDCPWKNLIFTALGCCIYSAQGKKVGGFEKKDGSIASYGLEVQCAFKLMKGSDEPSTPFRSRNSGSQRQKGFCPNSKFVQPDRTKKLKSKFREYARFDDGVRVKDTTRVIRREMKKENEAFFKTNYGKLRSYYLGTSKFRWYNISPDEAWELEQARRRKWDN